MLRRCCFCDTVVKNFTMEKENIKIMNAKQIVGLVAAVAQSPYLDALCLKEEKPHLHIAIALILLVMNRINKDTELSYDRFVFLDNYKKNEREIEVVLGYYNNQTLVKNVNKVINSVCDGNYSVKEIRNSDILKLEIEWLVQYFYENLSTTYFSEHASLLRGPQTSYLRDEYGNRRDKYS